MADTTSISLGQMPQRLHARLPEDDWTGITSAAERRKLQNRLNQRLYRRRRGAKPKLPEKDCQFTDFAAIESDGYPRKVKLSRKLRALLFAMSSRTGIPIGAKENQNPDIHYSYEIDIFQLERILNAYEVMTRQDFGMGSPRIDQLLTLVQFNVFRGLLSNVRNMGWTMQWLECGKISPWNSSDIIITPTCPPSLYPTPLQRTIKHHPWIDPWPIPQMRDNLLLVADSFHVEKFCNDLLELHDVANEHTGLIVWGEPSDPSGWEVSEAFARNWGWTLKGCHEVLQSTNKWRASRGEAPLILDV